MRSIKYSLAFQVKNIAAMEKCASDTFGKDIYQKLSKDIYQNFLRASDTTIEHLTRLLGCGLSELSG